MTMDAWAWAIVLGAAALTVLIATVLARQPHPGDLSEQEGRPKRQGRHTRERPAGPDAEPMAVDGPGQPSVEPVRPPRPEGPLPRRRPRSP